MSKEIITSTESAAPIGPYSQAVKAGNTLYVSGQIPADLKIGELVQGTVAEEARQSLKNLEAILKAAEYGFEDVVKATIYLRSMDDFAAVNEVYGQFVGDQPPARETVAVAGLPKNVRVEISVIAWKA